MTRFKKLIIASLLIIPIVICVVFWRLPLSDTEKFERTQGIVEWLIQGRQIPDFTVAFWEPIQYDPHLIDIDKTDLIYLACDFIPEEVEFIRDPRIKRVTSQELSQIRKNLGFRTSEDKRISYFKIETLKDSNRSLTLYVYYGWGSLASVDFRFTIFRNLWGLRTKGRLIGVS